MTTLCCTKAAMSLAAARTQLPAAPLCLYSIYNAARAHNQVAHLSFHAALFVLLLVTVQLKHVLLLILHIKWAGGRRGIRKEADGGDKKVRKGNICPFSYCT